MIILFKIYGNASIFMDICTYLKDLQLVQSQQSRSWIISIFEAAGEQRIMAQEIQGPGIVRRT